VARDRKRRRQRSGGTPTGGAADLSRDVGTDDATIDRGPLGEGTPAPDPLKNASADVDQARLAEAGSGRGASGDVPDEEEVEYLPAPDQVEGDAPRRRRAGSVAASADDVEPGTDLDPSVAEEAVARPARSRGRLFAFLGHCVDELRRVQWPDRKAVGQATAVVLGFLVLAGGYLGLLDALWKPLVNALL
jgi:preprotein translocase SecE subunit